MYAFAIRNGVDGLNWESRPAVDDFRTFEWPKPEMLEALYAR